MRFKWHSKGGGYYFNIGGKFGKEGHKMSLTLLGRQGIGLKGRATIYY